MKFRLSLLLTTYLASAATFAATEVNLRNQTYDYLQRQPSKVKIKKIRSRIDFNQIEHVHIQQTFNDIPVWDATGVVHIPNTKQANAAAPKAIAMNGMIYEGLEKDLASTSHALAFSSSQKTKSMQFVQAVYGKKNNISMPKWRSSAAAKYAMPARSCATSRRSASGSVTRAAGRPRSASTRARSTGTATERPRG